MSCRVLLLLAATLVTDAHAQWAQPRPLADFVSNFNRRAFAAANYEAPTPPVAAALPSYFETTPNPYRPPDLQPRPSYEPAHFYPNNFPQNYPPPQPPPLYGFNPSSANPKPTANRYEAPAARPDLYEAPIPSQYPQGISYYQPNRGTSFSNKKPVLLISSYANGGGPDYQQPQGPFRGPSPTNSFNGYPPPNPPTTEAPYAPPPAPPSPTPPPAPPPTRPQTEVPPGEEYEETTPSIYGEEENYPENPPPQQPPKSVRPPPPSNEYSSEEHNPYGPNTEQPPTTQGYERTEAPATPSYPEENSYEKPNPPSQPKYPSPENPYEERPRPPTPPRQPPYATPGPEQPAYPGTSTPSPYERPPSTEGYGETPRSSPPPSVPQETPPPPSRFPGETPRPPPAVPNTPSPFFPGETPSPPGPQVPGQPPRVPSETRPPFFPAGPTPRPPPSGLPPPEETPRPPPGFPPQETPRPPSPEATRPPFFPAETPRTPSPPARPFETQPPPGFPPQETPQPPPRFPEQPPRSPPPGFPPQEATRPPFFPGETPSSPAPEFPGQPPRVPSETRPPFFPGGPTSRPPSPGFPPPEETPRPPQETPRPPPSEATRPPFFPVETPRTPPPRPFETRPPPGFPPQETPQPPPAFPPQTPRPPFVPAFPPRTPPPGFPPQETPRTPSPFVPEQPRFLTPPPPRFGTSRSMPTFPPLVPTNPSPFRPGFPGPRPNPMFPTLGTPPPAGRFPTTPPGGFFTPPPPGGRFTPPPGLSTAASVPPLGHPPPSQPPPFVPSSPRVPENPYESTTRNPMVPNRIRGKAHVICEESGIDFGIKTIFPFTGQIFAHDRKRVPNCVHTFRNALDIDIAFSYAECGIKNAGNETARTQYHLQIIVMFEQPDGTTSIQSFMAQCVHQKISYNKQTIPKRIEEALEELKLVPAKLEQKAPIPVAEMRIVKDVEHHGMGDGEDVGSSVEVGTPLRIEFNLKPESDAYGFHVRECYVIDAVDGARHQVIDERGCSTDINILGHPHYDTYHDVARIHWHAFKVPDNTMLNIKCNVQICTDIPDSSSGLTSCDAIPTPPFCPDLITSPSNSILFDVEGNLVKRDINERKVFSHHVHADICFGNATDGYCNSREFETQRIKHLQRIHEEIESRMCMSRLWLAAVSGLSAWSILFAISLNVVFMVRRKRVPSSGRSAN